MKKISTEHVYTIEGTEQEARDYKRELQERYEQVDVYPTPTDYRIVCTTPRKNHTQCPLCDARMFRSRNQYWSCEECPAILFEYVNTGDAIDIASVLENNI